MNVCDILASSSAHSSPWMPYSPASSWLKTKAKLQIRKVNYFLHKSTFFLQNSRIVATEFGGDADSDKTVCRVFSINSLQLQKFASLCSQMLPWQPQGFKSHLLDSISALASRSNLPSQWNHYIINPQPPQDSYLRLISLSLSLPLCQCLQSFS